MEPALSASMSPAGQADRAAPGGILGPRQPRAETARVGHEQGHVRAAALVDDALVVVLEWRTEPAATG